HGRARDFIEGDAIRPILVQAQRVADVPGNGFAFAVGVGCQEDAVRFRRFTLQLGQDILRRAAIGAAVFVVLFAHDIRRFPAAVYVDAGDDFALLAALGQVADMAVAGENAKARAEVLIDGLGLGGRFDDDKIVLARAVA